MNENGCAGASCQGLTGVGCDVKNCKYHSNDDKCYANSITVESPSAVSKSETFCGTFTPIK